MALSFTDFKLHSLLEQALQKAGFTSCTPIQEQAVPLILAGKDVAGLAQTGTGKTAAFLLPLMERILRARAPEDSASDEQKQRAFSDWRAQNFILILVPTRELAEQVMENINLFGEFAGLRGAAIYGGTGYDKQKEALRNSVEFIAATPGRLIDLYKENLVDLKQVRAVVFDEADRMFDMGFKDDMKFILQRIPQNRQYLVFSATLNFDVLNTAYQFGSEPVEVNISRDQAKAENVKDEIFHVSHEEKAQHLLSLLKKHNPKQAIIFTNFKMNVDRVAKFLNDNGVVAMGISSLLSQTQRTKVIESFKQENDKNILVATDVAARGLDIKGVDMVINFELPQDSESYVHRIGRTGRAQQTGIAFSLVCDRDVDSLMRIEDYLKHKVQVGFLEDADLIKDFKPYSESDYRPGRMIDEAYRGGSSRARPQDRRERDSRRGGPDRKPRGEKPSRRPHEHGARSAHANGSSQASASNRPEGRRFDHKHTSPKGQRPQENSGGQPRGPKKPFQKSQGARAAYKKPQSISQKVAGFFKRLFS